MARAKHGQPKFVLVGNKLDKEDEREVSSEEGYQLAQKYHTPYFLETSALTRYNIDDAYEAVVRLLRASSQKSSDARADKPPKDKKKKKPTCVIM